ncbi:MAG: RIP metalloprotease RseP [Candidatus Loosdrechtia sp.]|uniref:RIP metalloprotease RseP n=1 Tax=Candidatus Loosdrechtia sp. TaxID=3101272 RepID=UPI003A75E153|nr:MAG: RIP metalloprotease RseP [Candidatus Jettenia sp. AMX2]
MPYLSVSTNVILVIVGIGLLIFIHELGHFLMAKKIGVRVYAFSLGFGPALFKKQWGETEYRLSLIPLGGYVKLAGETPEEKKVGEPWEFSSKTIGQRASVLVAGVALNAALAFFAFIVAFQIGVPFITSEVGQVVPGWPAWEAGIKRGDKIIGIDGNKEPDFEDLFTIVALSNPATGVRLKVEREDKIFDVTVKPKYDAESGIQRIGIMPATSLEIDKIFAFENNISPARDAGLQIGDVVVAVNGKRISTEDEFREIEAKNPGREITITVLRDKKEAILKITLYRATRWMLGISCATNFLDGVKENSIASKAGLVRGDEIIKVNSHPVMGFTDIRNLVVNSENESIVFTVKRNDKENVIPVLLRDMASREEFLNSITPFYGLKIDSVVEGFPAEKIGLQPGDKILSLDEDEVKDWNALLQKVMAGGGKPMVIEWVRDNKRYVSTIEPQKDEINAIGNIGIKFKEKTVVRQYGLLSACVVGTQKAIINVQRIYLTLKGFFSQRLSPKNVGGIILIAQASYESAKVGIGKLVYFLGILSLQLAFLNILPIPVLDGGHLMFLAIERIKGSPVSQRTLAIAQYMGFGFIIALVIYATRNDIIRLLSL